MKTLLVRNKDELILKEALEFYLEELEKRNFISIRKIEENLEEIEQVRFLIELVKDMK